MARTLMTVNYCNFQYFNRDCDRIYRPGGSGDYLFLLLHSEMAFRLPEGAFQNRPGACILYTPGTPQDYQALKTFKNSYVHFSAPEDFVKSFCLPENTLFYPEAVQEIDRQIQAIHQAFLRRDRYCEAELDSLLEQLFVRTARSLESFPDENHASLLEDTFQEIRLAILSSCEKPWTIRQMSQMAGMEKSQFYRYYQQFFHISPGNDLIQARIQRAKYLLTNQAAQIQQIAVECGFSEATHFSRQFKRCTGMSPRQYAAGYSGPSLADTPFARKNPASAGAAAPSFRHPAAPPSECPPVPASRKNPSGSLSTSPKPASQKPSDR